MLNHLAVPPEVTACLSDLTQAVQSLLNQNLVGVYVHGSIAMGCFKTDSSDIDILIVIEDKLDHALNLPLLTLFDNLAHQYQQKLELSIIRREVLTNFTHPTPFEFHYPDPAHNQLKESSIVRTDADLAGHFVITRQYGIALIGSPVSALFPEISRTDYLDSIVQDAYWCFDNIMAGADSGSCRIPKYAVLNFCRVLAFIHEDLVTSKQTGGEWGLANLPPEYHPLIEAALQEYAVLGSSPDVDCNLLKQFATYVHGRITNIA